ncbi:MAG: hypothetical protein ABL982_08305 [Vicinamibacterales bacterium]
MYGVRIGPAGEILDAQPFKISGAPVSLIEWVDVVFDQTDFMVTWSDGFSQLRARRVRQDGTLVETEAVTLLAPPTLPGPRTWGPQVAFNGTSHLLVWIEGPQTAPRLSSMLVSRDLVPLSSPSALISTTVELPVPAVEAGAGEFQVAWAEAGCMRTAKVTAAGTALAPVTVSCAGIDRPALVFGANQFLLVWGDSRNGPSAELDLFAARVTTAGVLLDPNGFSVMPGPNSQHLPRAAFDGTNYFLVWQDHSQIRGARVSPTGTVLDSPSLSVSPGNTVDSSLTFGNGRYLVTSTEQTANGGLLRGVRLEPNGVAVAPNPLRLRVVANRQTAPAVASSGQSFMAVWEDDRFRTISGARYLGDGGLLDSAPILLSEPATQYSVGAHNPAVTFDGEQYVVAFQGPIVQPIRIVVRRVAVDGGLIDATPLAISTGQRHASSPRIASNGASVLVAWSEFPNGAWKVYLAELDTRARTIAVLNRAEVAGPSRAPAVVAIGADYLVAWEQPEEDGGIDVFALPWSLVRSPTPPAPSLVSSGSRQAHAPVMASDGVEALVLWSETAGLYADAVSSSGAQRSLPRLIDAAPARAPTVVFDGTRYVAAWETMQPDASWDVVGAQLDSDGGLVDGGITSLASASTDELNPELAAGDGVVALVYSRWDDRSFARTDRVHFRLLEGGAIRDAGHVDAGGAGTFDAGTFDAGTFDAGTFDAGTFDAGTFDAGTFDAGTFDAGTFDAGTFDAGTFDGGTFDAGTSDAGTSDAGTLDAGPRNVDGGEVADGVLSPAAPRGCGCTGAAGFLDATSALVCLCLAARRKTRPMHPKRPPGLVAAARFESAHRDLAPLSTRPPRAGC